MAQLILSEVGGYVGGQLLPQGVSILGQQVTGQAIGSFVGSLAGSAIDGYLFAPRVEGPRISQLHLTQSVEGAAVPNVYGRMRLGCNVIWAARFEENRKKSGKGGPKVTTYSYTLSFAVGLCEGQVSRISRAWANGAALDLSRVNWRLYHGTEDQLPDPLIEAIEGTGNVPGYKGLAYIVFEDLPLDDFGGRIPQLSFEVVRPTGSDERMENAVQAVNLIPGSGEFAYATQIVRREVGFGVDEADNMHNGAGQADFLASLDQLLEDFPDLSHVNLIVGWFGSSIDCAQCEIRPGVELRGRKTRPWSWTVAGQDRESAYLISSNGEGRPNYGGTPDDQSVRQAIEALKARGLKVTLYPFVFMDSEGFPWRGRIACDPAVEMTAAAADAVSDFFGTGSDWRYRRFITHYAQLAVEAGGVDAFLIGSEMVGLTRVRSDAGVYPAVGGIVALAAEVRAIVGTQTQLSYAADWTEYGAHVPPDGSGDVDFPLDDLWADTNIDFIGLDWYAPLGDWRDGASHLDALAGYASAEDPAYLGSQIEGGEGYDWYYADASDRDAQIRTPITDGAHAEPWIYRQKDIRNWWMAAHHARPGGVRNVAPTAWVPQSKPVRFVEFGCPAVDKGTNQPNVFYDPKSDESALPHYSTGARDDIIQRRTIESFHQYWSDDAMLDEGGIAIWAWDMRPFPAWPLNTDLWSDGGNWRLGHWLNGRAGLALLSDVVDDLCRRAGIDADVSGLTGLVTGYALEGVMSLRDALEPLRTAFDVRLVEGDDGLVFANAAPAQISLTLDDLVMPDQGTPLDLSRAEMEQAAQMRVRLSFIDSEADGQPGIVLSEGEADAPVRAVLLAITLDRDQALRLANALAQRVSAAQQAGTLSLSPARMEIEPGDVVSLDAGAFQILKLADGSVRRIEAVRYVAGDSLFRAGALPSPPDIALTSGAPLVAILDAPPLPGEEDDARPLVFASAYPWPGSVQLLAGPDVTSLTQRCELTTPSIMGQLLAQAPKGLAWRWNRSALDVEITGGDLESVDASAVLNGANAALLETANGWELLQYRDAQLVGDNIWRLTDLLRGQQGSEHLLEEEVEIGARIMFLTGAQQRMELSAQEYHLPLVWRAQPAFADPDAIVEGELTAHAMSLRQWAPAHVTADLIDDDLHVSWVRRGRRGGDGWEAGEPLLDGAEAYLVEVKDEAQILASRTVATTQTIFSSTDIAEFPSVFKIQIAQLGPDQSPGTTVSLAVTISP